MNRRFLSHNGSRVWWILLYLVAMSAWGMSEDVFSAFFSQTKTDFLLVFALFLLAYLFLGRLRLLKNQRAEKWAHGDSFAGGLVAELDWDSEARHVLTASRNLPDVLGVSRERLLTPDSNWHDLIASEDRERVRNILRENINEKKNTQWQQIYRVKGDDGRQRWIREYAVAQFDDNGVMTRVHGYLIDDSDNIVKDKRVQMLSGIFMNASECICVTDSGGNIRDVNPAFERTTGYLREDILGENPRILKSGRHNDEFYRAMWGNLTQKNFWQGEIWNRRKNGEIYPELLSITAMRGEVDDDLCYVGMFTDISYLKEQQYNLERLAHYDALTGLPNRTLFMDRLMVALAKTKRNKNLLAVAFLDVDNFKLINDTHGYRAGDEFLICVAQRITRVLRASDTVARIGGDEFALVLCDGCARSDYINTINRVLAQIAAPFSLKSSTISLSASIGITFYPEDNSDPDSLFRHADQAMYFAKRAGRARYQVFSLGEEQQTFQQMEDLAHIERALDRNEFRLYYQPTVNLRTGNVTSMSTLLRWQHAKLGLLSYPEFISHIAGTELEIRIGEWVIRTAFAELNYWHERGLDLGLAINVSLNQLLASGFLTFFEGQLQGYPGLQPSLLEIDILAFSDLGKSSEVAKTIQKFRDLGVAVAMGDFGIGYSSLAALRSLPVNILKLDQSFVGGMLENPEDLTIVESIINLASTFGHQVIAEGVESASHGKMLLCLGCDYVRGYGISRPMGVHAVVDWLREWRPSEEWHTHSQLVLKRQHLPLLAMEVNICRWSERLFAYVLATTDKRPQFDEDDDCDEFELWYRNAAFSYGGDTDFIFLQETMYQLRMLASAMFNAVTQGLQSKAEERIDDFMQLRGLFFCAIRRLIKRET